MVEGEPKKVGANGNGYHDAIGPTVELVLCNGHVPDNGNGNGYAAVPVHVNSHGDAILEPQPSTFSWAEFFSEDPVKPKDRTRKPQPATLSMFE